MKKQRTKSFQKQLLQLYFHRIPYLIDKNYATKSTRGTRYKFYGSIIHDDDDDDDDDNNTDVDDEDDNGDNDDDDDG